MKIIIYLTALFSMFGCISKKVDTSNEVVASLEFSVIKKTDLRQPTVELAVKLDNLSGKDIFLDNDFNFKIFKEDSVGNYFDFTKSWLISETTILEKKKKNTSQTQNNISIQSLIDSVVNQISKENKDVKYNWEIRDQVEILYKSFLFLHKGQHYTKNISLNSLLIMGGRYKIFYHYKPNVGEVSNTDGFKIEIPKTIKGYNRFQYEIISDSLYLNFK